MCINDMRTSKEAEQVKSGRGEVHDEIYRGRLLLGMAVFVRDRV